MTTQRGPACPPRPAGDAARRPAVSATAGWGHGRAGSVPRTLRAPALVDSACDCQLRAWHQSTSRYPASGWCTIIEKGRSLIGTGPWPAVELRGFEPLTPSMRTRCATGLRYSPKNESQRSKLCLLLAPPMSWPPVGRLRRHGGGQALSASGCPGCPDKASWLSRVDVRPEVPDAHGEDSRRDRR